MQPQFKKCGFWWNFYEGYSDGLVEFDTFTLADEFVLSYVDKQKNKPVVLIKEYNIQ